MQGLNGYFGAVCSLYGGFLTWQQGLASVFVSGIIYLVLTFSGLRTALFRAVPKSLRAAITVGIGMFLTIIGFKIGQILRISFANPFGPTLPAIQGGASLPIDLQFFEFEIFIADFVTNPVARVSAIGFMWLTMLLALKWPATVITAIVLTTFCGINYGSAAFPVTNLSAWTQPGGPTFIADTSTLAAGFLDFSAANTSAFWEATFTFLFVELFDSFGTITATVMRAGLFKDERVGEELVNRAMAVDGFGLSLGAIIGSNSITCYIESNTGIESGARTGFASVITGSAFLLCLLFLQPFVGIIPDAATMPALVIVGALSLSEVRNIDFDDIAVSFPAFLGIALMGFTYSIANGICGSECSLCPCPCPCHLRPLTLLFACINIAPSSLQCSSSTRSCSSSAGATRRSSRACPSAFGCPSSRSARAKWICRGRTRSWSSCRSSWSSASRTSASKPAMRAVKLNQPTDEGHCSGPLVLLFVFPLLCERSLHLSVSPDVLQSLLSPLPTSDWFSASFPPIDCRLPFCCGLSAWSL